jgi:hypothetical protein
MTVTAPNVAAARERGGGLAKQYRRSPAAKARGRRAHPPIGCRAVVIGAGQNHGKLALDGCRC